MFRLDILSDDRIIRRVLQGDRDSFEVLVARHLQAVRAVAYACIGNSEDADDVAQETFLKAFEGLGSLREHQKFAPWLMTIARNTAYTFLKSRVRLERAKKRLDTETSVDPDIETRELSETVRKRVMQLDDGQREILLLRYYSGKSTREIAALLDISKNAAVKRLSRARDSLGKTLLDEIELDGRPHAPSGKQIARIMAMVGAAGTVSREASAATGAAGVVGGVILMKKTIVAVTALVLAALTYTVTRNRSQEAGDTTLDVPATEVSAPESTVELANISSDIPDAGDPPNAVIVELPKQISIRGTTVDDIGRPVPYANVDVTWLGGEASTFSGDDGAFEMDIETAYAKEGTLRFGRRAKYQGSYFTVHFDGRYSDDSITGIFDTGLGPLGVTGTRASGKRGGLVGTWNMTYSVEGERREDEMEVFEKETGLLRATWTDRFETSDLLDFQMPHSIRIAARADGLIGPPQNLDLPREGLKDINVLLLELGSLAGYVVDAEGNPVDQMLVVAETGLRNMGQGLTDRSGAFEIAGLSEGNYDLFLKEAALTSGKGVLGASELDLGLSEHKHDLVLVWEGSWLITGTVTNVEGEPLANARIGAQANNAEMLIRYLYWNATTAEDGSFEITGLPPRDDYLIYMSVGLDGHLNDYRQDVRAGSEQHFVLQHKPTITGHVVDAVTGDPVKRFTVATFQSATGHMREDEFIPYLIKRGSAIDDAEGMFEIESRIGNLYVGVGADGYTMGMTKVDNVAPGDEVTGVTVRLQKSSGFEGIVVDHEGNPVSGARIFQGYPIQISDRGWDATSGSDGTFRITSPSPTTNIVTAYRRGLAPTWIERVGTAPVRIVLGQGGSMEGVIRIDGEHAGKGVAFVHFLMPNGWPAPDQASTDASGSYRGERLTAGSMGLDIGISGWDLWLYREVEIVDGETIQEDFDFITTHDAAIDGVVYIDGVPATSARLRASLVRPNGDDARYMSNLGAGGRYHIGSVPEGRLTLEILWASDQFGNSVTPEVYTVETRNGEVTTLDIDIVTE